MTTSIIAITALIGTFLFFGWRQNVAGQKAARLEHVEDQLEQARENEKRLSDRPRNVADILERLRKWKPKL